MRKGECMGRRQVRGVVSSNGEERFNNTGEVRDTLQKVMCLGLGFTGEWSRGGEGVVNPGVDQQNHQTAGQLSPMVNRSTLIHVLANSREEKGKRPVLCQVEETQPIRVHRFTADQQTHARRAIMPVNPRVHQGAPGVHRAGGQPGFAMGKKMEVCK